jgi:hypothetical protein
MLGSIVHRAGMDDIGNRTGLGLPEAQGKSPYSLFFNGLSCSRWEFHPRMVI